MKKLLFLVFFAVSILAVSQQNNPLPIDPNVKTGVLENGLTYYIRHNKTPENRVDFYIAQKVGSMLEEDSQAGLAHFLEHMAFNGTTNFPGKTMLEYLQDNGIKFGTNINAYTSFDETVYYISNVPSTNKNLVDSCLLVLYDWSNGIALEEEEIDNERGVIREEWRTRGGAQYRIWEKLLPGMFPGSKYANRLPIGSIDVINNFKPQEIRDYYHKWYRPDLQGIIIVGDIDADAIEQQVKTLFSTIKLDPDRAERVYFPVPDNEEPIATVATDPEATRVSLQVYFKHDPMPREFRNTQAGYVMEYITGIAASMLNQRFYEISEKPNSPFLYASAYDDDYFVSKTKDAWTLSAGASEDKVIDALTAVIRETERVKRHGFTVAEYERAKADILKSYENSYNNRDKQRNRSYTAEYVRSFVDGEPIPGIEYEYQMMQSVVPAIPLQAVNQTVQQLIGDKNIVITVTGPEKEGLVYPTAKELIDVFKHVNEENIEAYVEEVSNEPLVANPPKISGKIVKKETNEALGANVWRLSNGVTVVLKNTDFKNDEILMLATGFGGTSKYFESDPINSKMMSQVMNLGGVGNFSSTELPKILAGKTASAGPNISLISQGFRGSSSIKDFETMIQLVYLYFTAPRSDKDAFDSYMQRLEIQLKNIQAEPMIAFQDSMLNALYGNNPVTNRLKLDDLKKVDYDRIMQMYKQSFANPGSFTFTFVGNIDEEAVKPLILQYLGSLKGSYAKGAYVHIPMNLASGKTETVFSREMKTPKSSVFNAYNGTMKRTLKNALIMSMFHQILDIVYTEKVREEEGGTYGVSSSGHISRYPKDQTVLEIRFDTDPAKMEYLNKIVIDELKKVADEGPRQADFSKVKKNMEKNFSEVVKENNYWLGQLNQYYLDGDEDYTGYLSTLNAITPKDIQDFAGAFLSQGNEAIVVMNPKAEAEK
ncbi:MAG: insulinase family protein [Dysgonamonadaceae bacterium]|jgi:zinc protease|nr:insulinase family protein [Dysgonamonadaceae bacterium]